MKTTDASGALIYDALAHVNRSFDVILHSLEQLQELEFFGKGTPIKSVKLAVRETRAWTMFEILEVLHEREESEWTRYDRKRARQEGKKRGQ